MSEYYSGSATVYKELIKTHMASEPGFDETPLSGKKAAFADPATKKRAFENLTLPHIDALYGVALKLTRDRGEAENLVQDTFLRAFRFFDRYTLGTNCRAWLFKIMYNTFINGYNRRARAPLTIDSELVDFCRDEQLVKSCQDSETEQIVFSRILDHEVADALAKVPADFKVPILLADVQQFSYEEIAQMMTIPIGTVKSRIFRGRRILRELLSEYGRERGYVA